jgi:uncharacterized Zn finger protein
LGQLLHGLASETAVAWLPTHRNRPLASSPLISESSASLADRFITLAKLLAGEMPEDIEEVFLSAKVSLFPHKLKDLETECSCPDWSNPCKHTAAVFYLLAEEFDRDPFLLFKLRGLAREELFELLGYSPPAASVLPESERAGVSEPLPDEPLLEPAAFWDGEDLPGDLFGEVRLPEVTAALPRRLGSFPFWRGKAPFLEALEPFYLKAAPLALDVFLGLTKAPTDEAPAPVKPIKPPFKRAKTLQAKSPPDKRQPRKSVPKKKPRRKPSA